MDGSLQPPHSQNAERSAAAAFQRSKWKCGCFCASASAVAAQDDERRETKGRGSSEKGGWKAIPFIVGNEMCEKLAVLGLHSNLMVYFITKYNMKKVVAANTLNVWSGTTSMATLAGAYVADAFLGKFWTIAAGCISYIFGMTVLTLTALIPSLRPPPKHPATNSEMAALAAFFVLMTLGSAGIRPCSMAFGAEQMEAGAESKHRVQSFFNWYYLSTCVAVIVALTAIVYIQSQISWTIGFGICALLMLISTAFFFAGAPFFRCAAPAGSPFTASARVLVAAFRKRRLRSSDDASSLGLSNKFRWLNKAAMPAAADSRWTLSTPKEIEDVKSIIRTLPILSCGIVSSMAGSQQHTFAVAQALDMNRRLGSIAVPAASFSVFSMLTVMAWLPVYDRVVVPLFRKRGREITTLERMGVGYAVSAVSMAVAGAVESRRRSIGRGRVSAIWLVPQFCVAGLAEAFHAIGHLEFFYREFPEGMRSTAIAVSSCTSAVGRYLSAVLVSIVQNVTSHGARSRGWLDDDLDRGHLDRFYFVLAVLEVVNLVYFVACARWYTKSAALPAPGARPADAKGREEGKLTEMCGPPASSSRTVVNGV